MQSMVSHRGRIKGGANKERTCLFCYIGVQRVTRTLAKVMRLPFCTENSVLSLALWDAVGSGAVGLLSACHSQLHPEPQAGTRVCFRSALDGPHRPFSCPRPKSFPSVLIASLPRRPAGSSPAAHL